MATKDYRAALRCEVRGAKDAPPLLHRSQGKSRWVPATKLISRDSGSSIIERKSGPGIAQQEGLRRNPNGVLIRELVTVPASTLNMEGLRSEVAFLQQHVIIASLVNTVPQASGQYN